MAELYRIKSILSDGRKVYMSKRGCIHLITEEQARLVVELQARPRQQPGGDPAVYAPDLGLYGNRSLFLESLRPFVMVERAEVERADTPVDPEAFLMGGIPATEAGTFPPGREART